MDPYYVVRDEVKQSLAGVRTLYTRWRELFAAQSTSAADADEFRWTTDEIRSGVKSIEWDLADLDKTIKSVEDNRSKYNIASDEIADRRRFVSDTRNAVATIKRDVNADSVRARLERDERRDLKRRGKAKKAAARGGASSTSSRPRDRNALLDDAVSASNDRFLDREEQQQQMIMRKQDQGIESLSNQVGTLNQIGLTIQDELDVHDRCVGVPCVCARSLCSPSRGLNGELTGVIATFSVITEFTDEVDDTSNRMHRAIKQVDALLDKASNKTQYTIICVLTLVRCDGSCWLVFARRRAPSGDARLLSFRLLLV